MQQSASRERFIHSASIITLSLTAIAAAIAAVIPWLGPVQRPLDLVVPPVICVLFTGLLIALIQHPQRVAIIMRIALLAALLALAAPAWVYTIQAILNPGEQLVATYPPVAALFLALMVMAMIHLPTRQALVVILSSWSLVALPVLIYLLLHPLELRTPRGADLLMAYGPVFILIAVLLPVQRGLTGKIQQLVSEQARMEVMVNRDPLTRLYNRRFGEHVLQDLLARQMPAGVIMFDLDRFKSINDTHGHPIGDRVLQRVAQRCQELVRKDACVARWGGEEFLIVVQDVDASGLQHLAERMRGGVADLAIAPVPMVSASLGVAMFEPGDTLASLLQRVDQALYRAKQQGGNAVLW